MTQPIVSNFVHQAVSATETIIHHPSDRLSWQMRTYKRPQKGRKEKLVCIYVGMNIDNYFDIADLQKKFGVKLKHRYSKVCGTTYEVVIKNATWEQLDDLLLAAEIRQELSGIALRDPSYGIKNDWAGMEEFMASYTPRSKKLYELQLIEDSDSLEVYDVLVDGSPLTQVTHHKVFKNWGWQFSSLPLTEEVAVRQAIAHAKNMQALSEKYNLNVTPEGGSGYELN